MIRIHAACLPARLLPPCTDKEPKPSYCSATRKADFLSPNRKGGGEKGELWLLFWSLHVPPRSCQTVSTVACRKRQDNNPYSLPSYTPPAPSQTHAHLCPPTTTTRALLLSRNEQKSIRRIQRKFRLLLQRGHLERPDPTQCHRHSGDVISEGKNIMQHYLPLQVAQDGARLHLPPDIFYIKKNTHTISQRHRTHKLKCCSSRKTNLGGRKSLFWGFDSRVEDDAVYVCAVYHNCGHTIKQIINHNSK